MRPVRMSYPLPCAMDRLSMDRLLMDRLSVNGANVLSSALLLLDHAKIRMRMS